MAITKHVGPHAHSCAESRCGRLRAVLPGIPDANRRHDDGEDDGRIEPLSGKCGRRRGKDQEEQQRTAELLEQDAHPRQCSMLAKLVWSVLLQAFSGVGG